MTATLRQRIEDLELRQRAQQSQHRPFEGWTAEALRAELQRAKDGLPPSEAGLAVMARMANGDT